ALLMSLHLGRLKDREGCRHDFTGFFNRKAMEHRRQVALMKLVDSGSMENLHQKVRNSFAKICCKSMLKMNFAIPQYECYRYDIEAK
ncbi:hypothetical protein HAX54_050127, partial [Datura stramonium]|nr:hypothetical protein [Datura stramonium]